MSFFHIWITAASNEFNAQHPCRGHYSRRCHEARVSPMLWVVPLDGDEIQQITAIWCNLVSWDVDLYRLGSNHPTWSILRPANPWSDYHLRGFFLYKTTLAPTVVSHGYFQSVTKQQVVIQQWGDRNKLGMERFWRRNVDVVSMERSSDESLGYPQI